MSWLRSLRNDNGYWDRTNATSFGIEAMQAVLSARKQSASYLQKLCKSLVFCCLHCPGYPNGEIDMLYACKQLNIHQSSPPRNVWQEPEHLLIPYILLTGDGALSYPSTNTNTNNIRVKKETDCVPTPNIHRDRNRCMKKNKKNLETGACEFALFSFLFAGW